MNITLTLDPEVEKGLVARARERGLTLDAYLQDLVKKEAGNAARLPRNERQKAQDFLAWAKGHRPTKLLSEEAVSRATMYPDRA
jgi:hypothetical protein